MCSSCPGCDDANQEVHAYLWIQPGRSILIVGLFTFLNAAILELAYKEAGCRTYELDDDGLFDDAEKYMMYEQGWNMTGAGGPTVCQGKAFGLKPISFISLMATIGQLTAAAIMPLAGSIVDATDYRRGVGIVSGAVLLAVNAAVISIDSSTWLACMLMQSTVAIFAAVLLAAVVFGYLPELTTDEQQIARVSSFGALYRSFGMFGVMVAGVAIQVGLELGPVDASRAVQVLVVVVGGPVCFRGILGYRPRKRKRDLRPGYGLCSDGVAELASVWSDLRKNYPDCGLVLVGTMFIEAATTAVLVAAMVLLDLSGMPTALMTPYMAFAMVTTVIGPLINMAVSKCVGVKHNLLLAIGVITLLLVIFTTAIYTPMGCWMMAPFIGASLGWYYTATVPLFSLVVPKGQETKVSGLYIFVAVVLGWIPSLVITAGSESNQLRLMLLVLPLFWICGASFVWFVDTDRAQALAGRNEGEGGGKETVVGGGKLVSEPSESAL